MPAETRGAAGPVGGMTGASAMTMMMRPVPPAIPRTDHLIAGLRSGEVQAVTSAARTDWVATDDQLQTAVTALNDPATARLVGDVIGVLHQVGGGEEAGTFRPVPYGGQPAVVLPGLLTFSPGADRTAETRRSRRDLIARSPVLFGATGY